MNARLAAAFIASAIALSNSVAFAQSVQLGGFIADANTGCKIWNPHPQSDESVNWSGACVNGFAQGRGMLQWLKSELPYEKDEGEWKDGRQIGRGTQDWRTGRYDGEILNGEPHGQGVLKLRNSRYEGEFRNGKANGLGTVKNLDGVFKGTWKEGCLVGDKRRITVGVPPSTCP